MVKRLALFGLVLGILVFLSGCAQNEITSTPVVESKAVEEINLAEDLFCENVVCGKNEECTKGVCECKADFKSCGEVCITETDCCMDNDCEEGKICENTKCITPVCDYNEYFDGEDGKCVCEEGTKFCDEQKKCIPEKSCCMLLSCGRDFRCARTTFSPRICLNTGYKGLCKVIPEKTGTLFTIDGADFNIEVEEILQRGSLKLKINEKSVELSEGEEMQITRGVKLYPEEILTFGGVCKEEPVD